MWRSGPKLKLTSEAQVSATTIGKLIGETLYVGRACLPALDEYASLAVDRADELGGRSEWNVAKLRLRGLDRISLLTYEPFEVEFPALIESAMITISTRRLRRRSYHQLANPPILHRKELLLPAAHQDRARYAEFTAQLERLGAFEDTASIGTKVGWRTRLEELGITVSDHQVTRSVPPTVAIYPHRTALVRDQLSTPVRAILGAGLIESGDRLLDYGCGRGDDVRALTALGIQAAGWDPHYAPDAPLAPAEVVNLGFVLNVIESPLERTTALRRAYGLATRCLAVAVITASEPAVQRIRSHGDGRLSMRGTFQKYFRQEELKAFIETHTSREAVPAGPGLFFVFKDEQLEQKFLFGRQRKRAIRPASENRAPSRGKLRALIEENQAVLDELWSRMLTLGRVPSEEELDPPFLEEVTERLGSLHRAGQLCRRIFDLQELHLAAASRRDDLAVFFALNEFSRRPAYRSLHPTLQKDVRELFGSYVGARGVGRELLFSLGRPGQVASAAAKSVAAGLGHLDEDGFFIQAGLANRLCPVLRCYVGCAAKLYGDVDGADVIKVHLGSGKLTLLFFESFHTSRFPRLRSRVKVDMGSQNIIEADHRAQDQRLYGKSRYVTPDFPDYAAQVAIDKIVGRVTGRPCGQIASLELKHLLAAAKLEIPHSDLPLT